MRWLHPEFLILLPVLLAIAFFVFRRADLRAAIRLPGVGALRAVPRSLGERLIRLPLILRVLAMGLMIVAMARPQKGEVERKVTSKGIDMVLVVDVSGSMRARDLAPDRLAAAKKVLGEFADRRRGDGIALVAFATSAYTLCPTTLDYATVQQFIARLSHGFVANDRTAIGTGLATALRSLRASEAKSRVVVLLTDGLNNSGTIQPMQAAEAAKAMGVRVYTIGVGTRGEAMMPVQDPWSGQEVLRPVTVDVDEPTLEKMAALTGGKYFRATDENVLRSIYDQIDKLEKSDREYAEYDNFDEKGPWLLLAAIGCIVTELLLGVTRLRGLP